MLKSFQLITSAWMKSNAESYAGFLSGMDVHTYCRIHIEPFQMEIEHVGLHALATAIINEAGMAIEILYLDRSAGGEVTPHRWPVLDANGNERKGGPTIRLLYRPCVFLWTWTTLNEGLTGLEDTMIYCTRPKTLQKWHDSSCLNLRYAWCRPHRLRSLALQPSTIAKTWTS